MNTKQQKQSKRRKGASMKIAEALLLKADMDAKIGSLAERVKKYSVVQEGSEPHEDPVKLIKKVHGIIAERFDLVRKIEAANVRAKTADGRTVADALHDRDVLRCQRSILQHAIAATQKEPDRYRLRELKWVAVINVENIQKQLDDLAGKIRVVNAVIQETNWRVELE